MIRRFPFYKQLDSSDCGSAALRAIARYWGKKYTSQELRDKAYTARSGSSMLGIARAAEEIGFETHTYKLTWESFRDSKELPCIVHWRKNHFVVVYKIKNTGRYRGNEKIYISDPGYGLIAYNKNEFLKYWLVGDDDTYGIAMTMVPTEKFYELKPDRETKLRFTDFFKYLSPFKWPIIQLVVTMLAGSLISLVFPFLTQTLVDVGIRDGNMNFILMLLVAQLALTLGQLGNDLIRGWLMLHITLRVSISFISDFLNKLMRLPISFFDVKKVGDIMQRIGDNSRIQTFLTGSLISIVIAVITFIVYSVVMAGYNVAILLVFLFGSMIYVLWVALFLKKRRELDMRRFQEMSANQSNVIQLVTGMQEIKLNNCERHKLWEWESIQAKLYKISANSLALEQTQNVGGTFINQVKNIIVSFMAAKLVVDGNMTLGMMMAMQYIIGQLNAPIGQFISFVHSTQDASISLERLGEIYGREEEEPEDKPKDPAIPQSGDIEFRNVTFQYEGPDSDKVLNNINFIVNSGKVNAIVGVSGSGKTTILKLLLGFYRPVEGKVLLNGVDLYSYSDSAWRGRCGVVMQEGYIFSDTIGNNIGVSDETPDMNRIEYAAGIANIKEFVDSLPLGYNTMIGMEGSGISTGQKQRILIARAVYKNPDYIFMDEATNALDASNEKIILGNLEKFYHNRTVMIVAHRLSTVKSADHIIVLDKGRVAEQGTHRQLVAEKGLYYSLVKDQLELGG